MSGALLVIISMTGMGLSLQLIYGDCGKSG